MWSHQVIVLWVVFCSFVCQLNWNCEVMWLCQVMQGGLWYWFPHLITVLPPSCSCLVSCSPSEVCLFKFEICPQFQEIISIDHYFPCFGGGFLVCLFTGISRLGTYFFAPPPFSVAGSVFCQILPTPIVSVLWWVTAYFSILWGGLTLGAPHLLRRLAIYLALRSDLLPTWSQPSCLSSIYLLIVHAEISTFCSALSAFPFHLLLY
jgi:hypothetical protein